MVVLPEHLSHTFLLFLVKEDTEDSVESKRNSVLNDSSDSLSYRLDEPKDATELDQTAVIPDTPKSNNFLKHKFRSEKHTFHKKAKKASKRKIKSKSFTITHKSIDNVKENKSLLGMQNSHSSNSCIFTRSRSHESVSFRERILRSHTKKSPKFKNKFFTFENNFSKTDSSNVTLPIKKNPSKCSNKTLKSKGPPNLEIADMPNISVYSNTCSGAASRYNCRRSSLIMAEPPVLTPVEIKKETGISASDKKSESVEVKTSSNLCSQGCLKLTVRVRNNSTDSDHSIASDSNDVNQQFYNLHNDITVQSKGMVYEIIPVKCDGNHDANENLVSKKFSSSVSKSKKSMQCPSTDTVNIRISSPCYSHSLTKTEPELSLDSPMKPGTKRVRLILGNDSIDIDIPPSKNRKCI